MDLVQLWKVVSIGFTGFFGVLALLVDYRDPQTRRVTGWGLVSLFGIVLSSVLGMMAQFVDLNNEAAKAASIADENLRLTKSIAALLAPAEVKDAEFHINVTCDSSV